MSSCSSNTTFSVPNLNLNDNHSDELRDIEEAKNRALKNIKSLYNEIMTPNVYPEIEDELCYENGADSPVSLQADKAECKVSKKFKCKPPTSFHKYSVDDLNSGRIAVKDQQAYSILSDDNSSSELSSICKDYFISNKKIKITIPKPFSLCKENIKRQQAKELKIAQMKEELKEQSEKELKIKFTCKPVPKHVNLPLYKEMVARDEKRKLERKEKSHEIIKNVKPFELSYMKSNLTKSHSDGNLSKQSPNVLFKAKPLPKCILDENLSKKLQNKEEVRKILNAHRAEEMLKNSSLPFTPKNIRNSYTCYLNNKTKDKPKFSQQEIDAVTKRLYTIRCREALEDWNNKVLQNNLHINKDSTSHGTSKSVNPQNKSHFECTLPFYTFPVRMSTATILRDKQIREKMIKKEKREQTDDVIKIETERRRKELVKNIWPRLKSVDANLNFQEDISEKVKNYRESQKSRELEYLKELEDMMERVSRQNLLVERQSKESKQSVKDLNDSEEKLTSDKPGSDDVSESSEQHTEKSEYSSLPSED